MSDVGLIATILSTLALCLNIWIIVRQGRRDKSNQDAGGGDEPHPKPPPAEN